MIKDDGPPPHSRFVANPVSVIRIAGLSIEEGVLPSGRTVEALARLAAARADFGLRQRVVSDVIAAMIPTAREADKALARQLLEIKRDLFNFRPPRASTLAAVEGVVPEELHATISELGQRAVELKNSSCVVLDVHTAELKAGIDCSLDAIMAPDMLRAVAMTNPEVYRRLIALKEDSESLSMKIKGQIGLSAARYTLRASQKTSPLSSFGLVALGWQGAPSNADVRPKTFSHAEPNYGALDYVTEAAVAEIENLADDAKLCINSSARLRDGTHEWRRIRPVPADRRVRQTELIEVRSGSRVLTAIDRIVASANGTTMLGSIRNKLHNSFPQHAQDKLDKALAEAWRTGFLGLAVPSDGHPVDVARARVRSLSPHLRGTLSPALERFISTARDPSSGHEDVDGALRNFMRAGGCEGDAGRIRPIVFEDCTVAGNTPAAVPFLSDDIESALRTLLRLSRVLTADSVATRLRRILINNFKATYGEHGECRDIEGFIHDCSDEIRALTTAGPEEAERLLSELHDSGTAQSALHGAREELLDYLAKRAESGEAVVLTDEQIDERIFNLAAETAPRAVSHMFFLQATPGENDAEYVLNNIYPGAASTFSRFVPEGEPAVGLIGDYLRKISGGARAMELAGTFAFNAAVHPDFLKDVVSIPPFLSSVESALDVTKLILRYRVERDELVFTNDDHQEFSIYFTSILNPLAMPLPHQIVRVIGSWVDLIEDLGHSVVDRIEPDADGVRHLPRITLNRLVVARARLVAPRSALPDFKLSANAFFIAFNEWADRRDLPQSLFAGQHGQGGTNEPTHLRVAKPMPLDRWSPLAVLLLQKEIAAAKGRISLVEALPDVRQTVVTRGGKRVVAEYGVELTMLRNDLSKGDEIE